MTQLAINYGTALFELKLPKEETESQVEILLESRELQDALCSPIVSLKEKQAVIDRIFTGKFKNFLKLVCIQQNAQYLPEIIAAYREKCNQADGVLEGELCYVTPPSEEQLSQMKAFLSKKYGKKTIQLKMTQDRKLMGGFILRVQNYEYDWSYAGRLELLRRKMIR